MGACGHVFSHLLQIKCPLLLAWCCPSFTIKYCLLLLSADPNSVVMCILACPGATMGRQTCAGWHRTSSELQAEIVQRDIQKQIVQLAAMLLAIFTIQRLLFLVQPRLHI